MKFLLISTDLCFPVKKSFHVFPIAWNWQKLTINTKYHTEVCIVKKKLNFISITGLFKSDYIDWNTILNQCPFVLPVEQTLAASKIKAPESNETLNGSTVHNCYVETIMLLWIKVLSNISFQWIICFLISICMDLLTSSGLNVNKKSHHEDQVFFFRNRNSIQW